MIPVSYFAALAASAATSAATWERSDIHACLTVRDDIRIVAFRGSENLIDWWRDFQAIGPDPLPHDDLGPVHPALLGDVLQIFEQMDADLGGAPVILVGHSKGGSEAQYAAALRLLRKRPVIGVWTFGAPRAGALRGILTAVPGVDFRNGNDPVPGAPPWLDHPRGRPTQIGTPGWFPVLDHLMAAYKAALPA